VKQVANSDAFFKQPGPPADKAAWLRAFGWGSGPPMPPVWGDVEAALNAEPAQTWAGIRTARDSVAAAWPVVQGLVAQPQDMVEQMPQSRRAMGRSGARGARPRKGAEAERRVRSAP
jgi:hypothetical protein